MPNDAGLQPSATVAGEKKKIIALVGKNSEHVNKSHVHIDAPLVTIVEHNFTFKQKKDKDTKEKLPKRPALTLHYPVPTIDGLVTALSDAKQAQYLLDLVENDIYTNGVRSQLDENTALTQDLLDMSKLTIEAMANIPKNDRRGGGIAKEVWEEFHADYIEVMPAITGTKVEIATAAADIFFKKFQPVKTNKPVLAKLKERLSTWFVNTKNQEDFQECFKFLDEKIDELLAVDESKLLEAL